MVRISSVNFCSLFLSLNAVNSEPNRKPPVCGAWIPVSLRNHGLTPQFSPRLSRLRVGAVRVEARAQHRQGVARLEVRLRHAHLPREGGVEGVLVDAVSHVAASPRHGGVVLARIAHLGGGRLVVDADDPHRLGVVPLLVEEGVGQAEVHVAQAATLARLRDGEEGIPVATGPLAVGEEGAVRLQAVIDDGGVLVVRPGDEAVAVVLLEDERQPEGELEILVEADGQPEVQPRVDGLVPDLRHVREPTPRRIELLAGDLLAALGSLEADVDEQIKGIVLVERGCDAGNLRGTGGQRCAQHQRGENGAKPQHPTSEKPSDAPRARGCRQPPQDCGLRWPNP